MGGDTSFRLTVNLSYRVADSEYPGEYTHEFRSEEDAASLLRSLENGPLYVRYNPASPSDHAVDPFRDVRFARSAE
jgi:hypothetical protein